MIFYCTYKSVEGRVVEETVDVLSPKEAKRMILLKHPLAQFIGEPTIEKPVARFDNSKQVVATKVGRRILLIVISIAFLTGLLFLSASLFHNSSISKDENKTIITNDTTRAYAEAYRNLVSINLGDKIGTGFKLKLGDDVYLYTCLHCILGDKPIVARDSVDDILELGDLELFEGRDLVRFRLPNESVGFEIARNEDIRIGISVFAYGDTLGSGVMTQNAGCILAIGRRKIEIDAEVLQGNSGGPVLDSLGRVVGVISSGSIDNTIWSKDTRYENVRKFAERVDGNEWTFIPYADLLDAYFFVLDTYEMTCELREFIEKTDGRSLSDRVIRSFVNDQRYKGNFGYATKVREIYVLLDKMSDVEDERVRLWKTTNGKVGSQADENRYYEVVKKRNRLLRQAMVDIPLEILRFASEELQNLNATYFKILRDDLLRDINQVLIPAFIEGGKFYDRMDKRAYEAYQHDYKNAR